MSIRLQERDQYLLRLLVKDFLLLSREQIQQLIPRGVRRTNQRLAKLIKYKLLERREPEDRLSPSTVFYFLGERAARALHGYDPVAIRERRARAKDFGDSYLRHLHLVNTVHIKFRTHQEMEYQFLGWTPYDNTNWDNKSTLLLRPDGYVRFRMRGGHFCYFVEIDRGTERGAAIRKKLKAYHTFDYRDRFWEEFKQDCFRVLFVTTEASRSATLLKLFPSKIFWAATAAEMLSRPLFEPCWLSREGKKCALNRAPDPEQAARAEKRRAALLLAAAPVPPKQERQTIFKTETISIPVPKKMDKKKFNTRLWWKLGAGVVIACVMILSALAIRHAFVQNFSSRPETQVFTASRVDSVGLVKLISGIGLLLLCIFALST